MRKRIAQRPRPAFLVLWFAVLVALNVFWPPWSTLPRLEHEGFLAFDAAVAGYNLRELVRP